VSQGKVPPRREKKKKTLPTVAWEMEKRDHTASSGGGGRGFAESGGKKGEGFGATLGKKGNRRTAKKRGEDKVGVPKQGKKKFFSKTGTRKRDLLGAKGGHL